MSSVKIVECPRDAMQGVSHHIPHSDKIRFIRSLLKCNFHTLDCGSFVSAAAVPQMADTPEVLDQIMDEKGNTRLLVIVANERGAREALAFDGIDDLGFPFSVNETFQLRNANSNMEIAYKRLENIQNIAVQNNKSVVAYLSMAFGNPYGDPYDRDVVLEWSDKIYSLGIRTISLADTVGSAKTEDVQYLFSHLISQRKDVEFGAHLHAIPDAWPAKISAAWDAGCRRFDGAILGYGGCPFADDELTGNIPTEGLVSWLNEKAETGVNLEAVQESISLAPKIFGF
jgi:hydroxymethylglutaryl-CoA lyase